MTFSLDDIQHVRAWPPIVEFQGAWRQQGSWSQVRFSRKQAD